MGNQLIGRLGRRDGLRLGRNQIAVVATRRGKPAEHGARSFFALRQRNVFVDVRNTFALVNGSNSLDLIFRQPRGSLRPPAIYYSTTPANAGCAARRMGVPVNDGFGHVHLVVRCSGLKSGATAKLRIGPSVRRTFRLSKGRGSGRVHLDKPPGSVRPLMYVGTRPATAPCTIRSRQTRMARRTVDLRITSHCGRLSRGTRGELFVGGLLAEDR